MVHRTKREAGDLVNSACFAALLDKLVAVDWDLEPICGVDLGALPVIAAANAIAEVCDVLRLAIADLCNIIYQVDGLNYLPPEAAPASCRAEHQVR
jgi:hypothetical protein